VQFCSSGNEIDTQSDAWKNWEELNDMGDTVMADIISRNGLTPYADSQFLYQDFTYDTAHAYVKYYPYYTSDGDKSQYDTLILSQPAKQGEGGIWCVERHYDERGNLYSYLPSSEILGEADDIATVETAADYYSRLQKECDSGGRSDLLTPLAAAQWFVTESGLYGAPNPAAGSFAETDGLDTAYMAQNVRVQQLIVDLRVGRTVSDDELLSCAEGFTADTWGVLGRFVYGSSWWAPMKDALLQAAVGDQQDRRDQNLIHLYLSYSKTEGTIADGMKDMISALYQADPLVFDKTLDTCTPSEQARIRAALG
jgi:hypothetical protein